MQIPFFHARMRRSLAAALFLVGAGATSAYAAGTVGNGTPASCDETALDTALGGGGNVTFNCGGTATIVLTTTKIVTANTSIDGGNVITLDANDSVRHFDVSGAATFTLTGLTLAKGKATGQGGALYISGATNVTLDNVSLNYNNATFDGGAIAAPGNASLSLTSVKADGNTSGGNGGVVYLGDSTTLSVTRFGASNNVAQMGGGAIAFSGTTLSIDASAFSGNSATVFGAAGGAISVNPASTTTFTMVNSTFQNNSAANAGTGAAVSILSAATGTINNSTFADNSGQGTLEVSGTSQATLKNSIISNTNNNQNCLVGALAALTDGGNNLQYGGTVSKSCGVNINEADPTLGPLADNGGFTKTMALVTGSPAINAGNNLTCASSDQRGIVRPIGLNCDIGAYEATPPAYVNGPAYGGTVGVPYTFTYLASGSPTITFSIASGALPPGLSLSTDGKITGTPTAAGTYSGSVAATNGTLPNATQNFSIVIAAVAVAPAITSSPPPAGTVGMPYDHTYTATGSATITYAVTSGALPPGLTLLGTGQISGTPSATGTFSGTVTASNGTAPDATQNFSIVIAAAAVAPTITSSPPPAGAVNTPYNHTYAATGSATITFAVTSGALPPGLTLLGTGQINGTPGATGTFNGTVTASNGTAPDATQNFSIVIAAAAVAPAITNGPPPNGTVGIAYNFAYAATGTAPIAFTVTSGALPPGLTLSSAGVISGTPTTFGNYSATVTAGNGTAPDATQQFTIAIAALPQPPLPAATVAAPSLGVCGMLSMIVLLAIAGARRRATSVPRQAQVH